MSLRFKSAGSKAPITPVTQSTSVLVAEVTTTEASPAMVADAGVVPVVETGFYMKRNYLWAYLLVALIIFIIIIWYSLSGDRVCLFDKIHARCIEWIKGSSGRLVMGLFLAIALLLSAWAMAHVAGMYRMMCESGKATTTLVCFGILMILILAMFLCFYGGSFSTAYVLAILLFLFSLLITLMFAYYRCTGPAVAMALVTLWALMMCWVTGKVSAQNCSTGNGSSGSSGSNSSGSGGGTSPHNHNSPSPHPHPRPPRSPSN
jgi:hypothetical protein